MQGPYQWRSRTKLENWKVSEVHDDHNNPRVDQVSDEVGVLSFFLFINFNNRQVDPWQVLKGYSWS